MSNQKQIKEVMEDIRNKYPYLKKYGGFGYCGTDEALEVRASEMYAYTYSLLFHLW